MIDTCFGLPEQQRMGQSGLQALEHVGGHPGFIDWLWIRIDTCLGSAAQHLIGQSGPHSFMHDDGQTS
jgi:hypothetical protein